MAVNNSIDSGQALSTSSSVTFSSVTSALTSSSVTITGGTIDGVTIGGTTPVIIQGYLSINTQTGTTYTLVLGDNGKLVTLSNASPITLTIPTNASVAFPTGTLINLAQLGAGQVTVSPAGGVTMNSDLSLTKIGNQYTGASLIKTATNTWLLIGNLA